MSRKRLDLNPQDYSIHYRTRRWSATLIIAKTLRWFFCQGAPVRLPIPCFLRLTTRDERADLG